MFTYGGKEQSQFKRPDYHCSDAILSHPDVDGVTQSTWRFVHLTRMEQHLPKAGSMTAFQYPRPLQESLDNTVGARLGVRVVFETPHKGDSPLGIEVGFVSIQGQEGLWSVYNKAGLAPDIRLLPVDEQRIWGRANSVFAPRKSVICPVGDHEIFSMWDYKGKSEAKLWTSHTVSEVMKQ